MTSTAADLDTAADTAAGVLAFARDRRAAAASRVLGPEVMAPF